MSTLLLSERIQKILTAIYKQQNVANAYLFSGSRGSFISEAGLYFTKMLHCENKSQPPCLSCNSCKNIDKKEAIDLFYSDTPLKVEGVRTLLNTIKYGPSIKSHYVVIINHFESISTEAANALLKSLEEPPKGVCFLLLTDRPFDILSTIRSRSHWIKCPQLPTQVIQAYYDALSDPTPIPRLDNHVLMTYCLETNETMPEFFTTRFSEFLGWDLMRKLSFSQHISGNKDHVKLLLAIWLQDLYQQWATFGDRASMYSNLLIQLRRCLNHNINLRLQLDDFILTLSPIDKMP